MIHSFDLPIKPFSINAAYYKNRAIKTQECKAWEAQVLTLLEDEKTLHEMADDWRSKGGVFRVEFMFVHPEHIFFNKNGTISSKSFDLSNTEKLLLDVIFGKYMDVNDKNVVQLFSIKTYGPRWSIKTQIQLVQIEDRQSLREYLESGDLTCDD